MYKKPRQLSNTLFGFFLLFLSERGLKSLIYFFSDASPNFYSTFGPITFLFIGPFLLLYVLSVVRPKSIIVKNWKLYVLLWAIIATATHLIFPFRNDPIFYKRYILKGINIQWLIHILISGWAVFKHIKSISFRKDKLNSKNIWLCFLLVTLLFLWLIFFYVSYTYFVVGAITFSLIFYSFYLFFLLKKTEREYVFEDDKKYINKKIDDTSVIQLVKRLEILMIEQKPYKNTNLKSSDIANSLAVSTHQFSQLLNDNLGKSFSSFINEYRIEEAKLIIQSNTKYTLDAIGKESGFNSKSTFYTTFKRLVGMTPSKYKEQF